MRWIAPLALACALIGFGIFFYKHTVIGLPLTGEASRSAWTIEASLRFDARPGPIKASLRVPALTPGFATLSENSVSGGYGFALDYTENGRRAQWAIRPVGRGSRYDAAVSRHAATRGTRTHGGDRADRIGTRAVG